VQSHPEQKEQIMNNLEWKLATEVFGHLEAEMVRSYLVSQEIPCELFQEGAGQDIYPVNYGPLARVEIFVPADKLEEALILLEALNDTSGDTEPDEQPDADESEGEQ